MAAHLDSFNGILDCRDSVWAEYTSDRLAVRTLEQTSLGREGVHTTI